MYVYGYTHAHTHTHTLSHDWEVTPKLEINIEPSDISSVVSIYISECSMLSPWLRQFLRWLSIMHSQSLTLSLILTLDASPYASVKI